MSPSYQLNGSDKLHMITSIIATLYADQDQSFIPTGERRDTQEGSITVFTLPNFRAQDFKRLQTKLREASLLCEPEAFHFDAVNHTLAIDLSQISVTLNTVHPISVGVPRAHIYEQIFKLSAPETDPLTTEQSLRIQLLAAIQTIYLDRGDYEHVITAQNKQSAEITAPRFSLPLSPRFTAGDMKILEKRLDESFGITHTPEALVFDGADHRLEINLAGFQSRHITPENKIAATGIVHSAVEPKGSVIEY